MAGGVGTEQVAPLARMWRAVYKKAAEVAEARTQELLKYHVYVYPHRAGGGGGGGGLVELGRDVAAADGQLDLVVPASGALPAGYSGLHVVATGRSAAASGARGVWLAFNDAYGLPHFGWAQIRGDPASAAPGGPVDMDWNYNAGAIHLGDAPAAAGAAPGAVFATAGDIPWHAEPTLPKVALFQSAFLLTTAGRLQVRTVRGVYPDSAGVGDDEPVAIGRVQLRCAGVGADAPGWAAGSVLIVYGHPDPA